MVAKKNIDKKKKRSSGIFIYSVLMILIGLRRTDGDEESGGLLRMLRRGGQGEEQEEGRGPHPGSEEAALEKANKEKEDKKLPPNVALMKYILRFLQLLCENHNTDLQVRGR